MRKGICIFLSLMLFLLLLTGCKKANVNHLSLAEDYLKNKQYEQAVIEFYEYLLESPDDPRPYQGSAEAYLALGQTDNAIEQYEKMIKQFPTNPEYYHQLAPLLSKEKTINLYREYISQFPDSASGYLLLGNYLKESGDVEAAQDIFLDLLSKFPDMADGYIEVALYYFDNFRYITAISVLQDGIRITNDKRVIDTYTYVAGFIVVQWHDSYIETVIRNYLGNPIGAITLADLYQIQTININGNKIVHYGTKSSTLGVIEINGEVQEVVKDQLETLEDFSNFINLTELHIRNFPLETITPLTNLAKLKALTISSTNIWDIRSIDGISSLVELNLDDNRIVSLEPVRLLTKLTKLSLSLNYIEDLSPLSALPQLKYLVLSNNKVTNLEPILGIHEFEYLDLTGNKVKDKEQFNQIKAEELLY